MKKFLKIFGIVFLVLIVLSIFTRILSDNSEIPRQSIYFTNTSTEKLSVTFEGINEDNPSDDYRLLDEIIKPNSIVIEKVRPGRYQIQVRDSEGKLKGESETKFSIPRSKKAGHHLMYFDLAMDKDFYVLNLSAVFSGNLLAEHKADNDAAPQDRLIIEEKYDGASTFTVPERITKRTWVNLGDNIPTTVKHGEVVYGLYAIPKEINEKEVYKSLVESVIASANQ